MIGTILVAALAAGVVQDQVMPADAAIEILDSVNVGAVQTLRLRRPDETGPLGMTVITEADRPALIRISGDAARLYRIQVAEGGRTSPGGALRIWSANTGDISDSQMSTTDAHGRDLLRISGRLAAPGSAGAARTLAVSIHYD